MADLTFEEQDLIIDKLIEKYFSGKAGVRIKTHHGNTGNNPAGSYIDIKTNISYIKDLCLYKSDPNFKYDLAQASVGFSYNDVYKNYTIQEIQQKYFQDILTPTRNELVLFELSEGFEWPLAAVCGYAMD